jgi:hypothetical protein
MKIINAYAAQKLNEEAETGRRLQHLCGGNTVKFRFRVRVPAHTIKKIKRPVRRKSQRSVFLDPYLESGTKKATMVP